MPVQPFDWYQLRDAYRRLGVDRCLYTGAQLGSAWDMHHVVPWSRLAALPLPTASAPCL